MLRSFFAKEDGQGLVEYALILVLIAIVVIGILTLLGGKVSQVFSSINDAGGTRFIGFSAELTTSPMATVPEPATVALMATGLVALGGVVRLRRSQA